ncbi:4-O-beta-D-mannosyl-D-glucose phosphorylase [Yeosuana aromativorans]|uniref:4-O-beta-D-mannosyl-D-glucose phosphorylase n=1 Tax=Yeosuana aromativorans TaxID=288019 RepID=A0A8J3FHS2_9FLAO|nr:glycosidase [Yeosuana aromativorans]GGK22328.1 4-O-beta-D-mannosyl-D-glucose phosphorylase [Yeosuana aromativorans]
MQTTVKHIEEVKEAYQKLVCRKNEPVSKSNGIYNRYKNPVVTADHVPIHWRYDLNPETNPNALERIGFNAVMNSGAMKWYNKYLLCIRTEGNDRKSFFSMAESPNGIDNFTFWDKPCVIPQIEGNPDTNVYDMRLVEHEDGWIYGIFCTERKDPNVPKDDTSSAIANAGIVRTKDLTTWERLPDLISNTGQQRNVVLHPDFVNGKYALYTRPQQGFIDVGSGGGIGLGYVDDMTNPIVKDERIINNKVYHTIYELKNGLGPAPIKTNEGWLHLAHGVRNTAAGLRYTLYMFMTDLNDISKVIHHPAGYFMAPVKEERVGDVSNVLFSNGWIADDDGTVYIYYASCDTRMHVATSTVDKLVDYCINSPEDKFTSAGSVETILNLIDRNKGLY